jgi:hypothetical protein
MKRLIPFCSAIILAAAAHPALAHITRASAPHTHASDLWGLAAVAALMAAAVWLDRRSK